MENEPLFASSAAANERSVKGELRYAAMFQQAPVGIFQIALDGRIVMINPAVQAILGYSLEECTGQELTYFIDSDASQYKHPVLEPISSSTASATIQELRLRRKDGQVIWGRLIRSLVLDEQSQPLFELAILEDVTERKQREEMNATQARQLSFLFEAVPDAITVFDREGRIVQMNEGARRLLPRYTNHPDFVLNDRLTHIIAHDLDGKPYATQDLPPARILHGETLTGDNAQYVVVRTFDGEDISLNIAGAPLYGDAGNVTGAVTVLRDVTEQRRAVQRTSDALRALLHFAEVLVQGGITRESGEERQAEGMADTDQVAQRLATLMSQVLGYKLVSLTLFGKDGAHLRATAVHGLSPEQERAWRERRSGFTISEVLENSDVQQLLNGEAVIIDISDPAYAERLAAYGPRKLLLVPMAIDKQQLGIVTCDAGELSHDYADDELAVARALAQLAALTLERHRLFQEQTQTRATMIALHEANRLMDDFIGIAGHELRTPLTTLQASVQLARRQITAVLSQHTLSTDIEVLIQRLQDHFVRMERQIRRQNRLARDLLDSTRIQADRLELHPIAYDLQQLVRECVEDQRSLMPQRTLTFASNTHDSIMTMVDVDRVRQVMSNYLSNALKFSEATKPVQVFLDLGEGLVRVNVSDEGPGIARQFQERIWERFYRVPDIVVKSGSEVGLGLGLHISQMIIKRLGGQVGVISSPGEGSTFWFELPLPLQDVHV